MSEIEKSPARARSGAFSLGGDRRVGACASGDELVSLGFRVGNPSAIGWCQPRISSIPVTRRRHSDNEQKNRDAQFAPKNGQKPSRAMNRRHVLSAQEGAETIPRGGAVFYDWLAGTGGPS
jgi:hypothetical protein